ncbi:MAG: hypothetical protein M5U01_31490 [Ardenticatenaceae bacterium]|nr:hypothetical protein [Ardenticatenaceae bacterium]HBY94593.1 hypothetical protein [Chloroflexota bacterium]
MLTAVSGGCSDVMVHLIQHREGRVAQRCALSLEYPNSSPLTLRSWPEYQQIVEQVSDFDFREGGLSLY